MNLRLRGDLQITKRAQGREPVWIVKDPVSFSHFQFSDREFAIAKLLSKGDSIQHVVEKWQTNFKSKLLTESQVESFAQRLVQDNLLVVDRTGFGRSIIAEQKRSKSGSLVSCLRSPLAIRFRGINPTPLLKEFDWVGRLLFHPLSIVLLMFLSALTLLFMLGNFEAISERIPSMGQVLSRRGVIGLVLTMAIVKVLHELGHALACRRFGGECFEIGVMLLALVPTLFTNVTDAWTIPERWKRMTVSFAGMYVEICLAALAAIAWFLTPPGLLNSLLFNVVLLCSINTLLVNGNPLLRYDGYFLLSDWLEMPNLSQQAHLELRQARSSFFRKSDSKREIDFWLLAYAVASLLYRWFVIGVIFYGILFFASKWNAIALGVALCGLLLASMTLLRAVGPGRKGNSGGIQQMSKSLSWVRTGLTGLVLVGLISFVVLLPLPKSVYCEFEVQFRNEVPVFSPTDGQLVELVSVNESVRAGEKIGRLLNRELEQAARTKGLELSWARKRLEQLESRLNESPEMAAKVGSARKRIESVTTELNSIEEELRRMILVAPSDGVVVRSSQTGSKASHVDYQAAGNQNCFVKQSDCLVSVGDPTVLEAILYIPEDQMGFVELGQEVKLKFDRIDGQVFRGGLTDVFSEQKSLSSTSGEIELQKVVRVAVQLDDFPDEAVTGSVGRAKVATSPQTIASRVGRALRSAMNTRL